MLSKEFWNVSSIGLVSYLMTEGFEVIDTKMTVINNRGRIDFVFNNSKELHEAISEYKKSDFIQKYYENIQKVRDLIYKKRSESNDR